MFKINFVTMKKEIEDILMNSYDKSGNFDEPKATEELLNLFSVMSSNTKKQMENIEMKRQLKPYRGYNKKHIIHNS